MSTILKADKENPRERIEEVQYIIDKMPTNFGYIVTGVVSLIFFLFLLFGWIIRYPDVVRGKISINSNTSPVKLIASSSGKLKLNSILSMQDVKEGQIIAYIENPTDPNTVASIKTILRKYNPLDLNIINLKNDLPKNLSIGELNSKYYAFVNTVQLLSNFSQDRLHEKQKTGYTSMLKEQERAIFSAEKRVEMGKNALAFTHKFYFRDSLLFVKKVISEAELDKSYLNYLNSRDNYQNNLNMLSSARQQSQSTKSKIMEAEVKNPEDEKELKASVTSSYNDLLDNIKIWEQKYVFRATFNGKVQFLKFWINNQFIQAGESIFTVIPKNDKIIGQVSLPAGGAGKVKIGQVAIVKLDDYPFTEYGSVDGVVKSISLTSSTLKTDKGDVENYLITIDFPNQLKTNYGAYLDFKFDAKGDSEIIVNERRFIERLFDNLKYMTR